MKLCKPQLFGHGEDARRVVELPAVVRGGEDRDALPVGEELVPSDVALSSSSQIAFPRNRTAKRGLENPEIINIKVLGPARGL